MNLEKIKTSLEGYGKSMFPREVNQLNEIIAKTGVTLDFDILEAMVKKIQSPFIELIKLDRPTTEDGCSNWLAFHFETAMKDIEEGKIAVLLPCSKKRSKPERSVAVYAKGNGPCFAMGSLNLAIGEALKLLIRQFSKLPKLNA